MSLFRPNKCYILVGSSCSGKSYLLRYLCTQLLRTRQLKIGIVFTRTKFSNQYDWLPDHAVKERFSLEFLTKYLDYLKCKADETGEKLPNTFIILDDCIAEIPQMAKE